MPALENAVLRRGDVGYEDARRAAVANGRVPERFPAAVVRAARQDDAVEAVRWARGEGKGIAVRSGGHSWSGAHLCDDVVLLDLSALTSLEIDAEAMTATAGPGLRSSDLAAALHPHDLFFPTGHCTGPGLGGFLLQGGFGWNSRMLGPACMSVEAIDVVTAGGELVRASASENEDLFWAARGAGPLFFGVVTRFHLRLQKRPAECRLSTYAYPLEVFEEVVRWVHAIGPEVPRTMELLTFTGRDLLGLAEPVIVVAGPVLADSEEQARADMALLDTCPALGRALDADGPRFAPTDVLELVAGNEALYPTGWRYAADNMWTHATIDELLPGLRRIAETLPGSPSHMMWMNWGEPYPERPDMAFSSEDLTYLAVYGISEDPADDETSVRWVTDRMRDMEHLSSGIQLADENLARRPVRFMAPERLERLEGIRAAWDPEGRFRTAIPRGV